MTTVLSSFAAFDQVIPPDEQIVFEHIDDRSSSWQFARQCLSADVVILNIDQRRLMLACLLRWALPFARFRLVSVDLVLRPPKTRTERIRVLIKRVLFSRVDRFVLYFRNLSGYTRLYGIDAERVSYVPFKVNALNLIETRGSNGSSGEYVLCAGRTLRDVETFVEAMRRAGRQGVLLQQKRELLAAHGSSAWMDDLPSNVKLTVDETDDIEVFLEHISNARMVVIPRFKGDIAPTGISTYLVAMALKKCVIISEGPGADDVLTDEAVIVPAEDAATLARQIDRLWEDDPVRSSIATRGYKYAMSCGDEKRLMSDILPIALNDLSPRSNARANADQGVRNLT